MSRRKTRHLSFYQCKEKPVFLLRFAHLFVPLHENVSLATTFRLTNHEYQGFYCPFLGTNYGGFAGCRRVLFLAVPISFYPCDKGNVSAVFVEH
jgi:hypothetical protein